MPIQEFPGHFSLGYNGTDYFSAEMAYAVRAVPIRLAEFAGARIALPAGAGWTCDPVFVGVALGDAVDETVPVAGVVRQQRIVPNVEAVEAAANVHRRCVRSPHAEGRAVPDEIGAHRSRRCHVLKRGRHAVGHFSRCNDAVVERLPEQRVGVA